MIEKMKVSLSAPDLTGEEKKLVMQVLSGKNLSMGPMLDSFEKEFAAYIGSKHAIAVNSGTSGLHLLVRSMGFKTGDEVITTPFSFVASANCLVFENVKPVFVDIDSRTLNIDIGQIEAKISPRTKGILPVHVFGVPAKLDRIREIACKYGLKIIEDSCEAIGAEYLGKKAGTLGDAGVFAFYPNKQMTTGEGGMIVTDNDEIAASCRSMRNQGRDEGTEWLSHDRLGYNYRLDEMSAALGLGQLRRIEEILEKRNRVAAMYQEKLANVEGVSLPYSGSGAAGEKISWFVFVVRLEPSVDRNEVAKYLKLSGIETKPYFGPIHLLPLYRRLYRYNPGDFPVTEQISKSTLALPFHNNLTAKEISYVTRVLKEAIAKTGKG